MRSASVVVVATECAAQVVGDGSVCKVGSVSARSCVVGDGDDGSSKYQSLVSGERLPVRMILSLSVMVTVAAVKIASQPWSQSKPMEMRDALIPGKMWAWRAAGGRAGSIARSPVWVDLRYALLGMRTSTGCVAGCISV